MAGTCPLCGEKNHSCGGPTDGVVTPISLDNSTKGSAMTQKRYEYGSTTLVLDDEDAARLGLTGKALPDPPVRRVRASVPVQAAGITPTVEESRRAKMGDSRIIEGGLVPGVVEGGVPKIVETPGPGETTSETTGSTGAPAASAAAATNEAAAATTTGAPTSAADDEGTAVTNDDETSGTADTTAAPATKEAGAPDAGDKAADPNDAPNKARRTRQRS